MQHGNKCQRIKSKCRRMVLVKCQRYCQIRAFFHVLQSNHLGHHFLQASLHPNLPHCWHLPHFHPLNLLFPPRYYNSTGGILHGNLLLLYLASNFCILYKSHYPICPSSADSKYQMEP